MWDARLPVIGSCPDCGEDVSAKVRIWASSSWGEQYQTQASLRRAVDRAVARYVMERHGPHCGGRTRRAS